MQTLRVSSTTNVRALANAVVAQYSDDKEREVCLEAVGASAVNQAVKAIAVANGTLNSMAYELLMQPTFKETGETKHTVMILNLRLSEKN